MFGLLKRIFLKDKPKQETRPMKYNYTLEVFEEDESPSGALILKSRGQLMVVMSNDNELRNVYKMCGLTYKIISKTPIPDSGEVTKPVDKPAPTVELKNGKFTNVTPKDEFANLISAAIDTPAAKPIAQLKFELSAAQLVKKEPKFYKIGDVEIKNDNGVIYLKQWMRLSPAEEGNLRVINSTNNKIVNLSGKHIEVKKWVKVDTDNGSLSDIGEILNG